VTDEPEFGPFLSSQRHASQKRRDREDSLRRAEFARQPVIDREFEEIVDDFAVTRPPRRWPWPIRAAITTFRTLDGIRKML